ncbi:uracil-DNA glycosylase [Pontibacillus halophilus JSM 076056 = DSM 19796]|uniref:Type-4 uracil-DNA glycosylase n=1 Tax=Pontibacillus halophilus JSM 076056 = DSM 19796 TaxID=1385510 RepID=A0A0A5GS30_9BACI|nr:uracil-DNA glycosylase [Pontibacillus halophilus]KGX94023.1 uracil-DNA glycosylase [Pontibacillus halophilus JSM 076056 = DSM 19796]
MKIPEHLIQLSQQRIQPYDVEGLVIGAGDEEADIVVVGEAPGENEIEQNQPFIGRAGKELTGYFEAIGITREDVYITSVVRSRPYKWVDSKKKGRRKANRKPNEKEMLAHAPLLDYQLQQIQPKLIVTLGGVAYERLTGRKDKMSDIHGRPFTTEIKLLKDENAWEYTDSKERYTLFPLYHPAAVFYNPRVRDDIIKDLEILEDLIGKL